MSVKSIIDAEEQLRKAMSALDRESPIPAKELDRLIILAADMADSARRIRTRALRFKHSEQNPNGKSH